MKYIKIFAMAVGSLGIMNSPALAHSGGHVSGMMAGLAHPLLGVDHLLVLFFVGVWAAFRPTTTAWQGPVVFLAMMAFGGGLVLMGLTLPFVEVGILASVLLLGLMIMLGRHLPMSTGLAAIAGVALLHGQAHGFEAVGAGVSFMMGVLVMTGALHLAGYGLGRQLHQLKYGAWCAGSLVAAGGLALITT